MITHRVTDNDFTDFCLKLAVKARKHFAEHYSNLSPPAFHADKGGRKYVRIVRSDDLGYGSRAVVCFIERSTGLIWKAASWKAPAKNFHRGSIYMANEYTGGFDIYHDG